MRFSDAFLLEVKFRNGIEEIISRYVPLKRAGANLVACCPFHSEKTPSFTVSGSKNIFHCFGCGAGGDVITFVMMIENLDYPSAVAKLAEWARIPLPDGDPEYKERAVKQKRIFEINREAALYFHNNLVRSDSAESKRALEYIYGRNIKSATIRHFGLGYASDSWNNLAGYLSGKGFSKEERRAAFLCSQTKKGDCADIFRGRLMFPIIDASGNVVAFGGRIIAAGGGDPRKYLNTSDTPAFKKSRNLYALNFAKNSLKKFDYFILCEGNIDVIALHQAGFTNAVATLGTAVTGEQARLIAKYTKRAVLAYDTDEAGKRAMQKASVLLGEVGIEVKVLDLGDAKDPDEYIQKYGREKLENILNKPKGYIDSKLDAIYAKYDLSDPNNAEEKIKAINESCGELALINSDIEREVYGVKLAERYKMPPEMILSNIKKLSSARLRKEKSDMISVELRKLEGFGDRVNQDRVKHPPSVSKNEETLLWILFNYPEIRQDPGIKDMLGEDIFITEFNKKIYKLYESAAAGSEIGFDTVMITKDLTPEESGRVIKIAFSADAGMIQSGSAGELAGKIINALKERRKNTEQENIDITKLSTEELAGLLKQKANSLKARENGKKKSKKEEI
jgi:DNA primase